MTIAYIADFVEKKARILTQPIFGDIISEPKSNSVLVGKRPANRRLSSFAADAHNPSSSTDGGVSDDTLVLGPREPTLSCPLCKATPCPSAKTSEGETSVIDIRLPERKSFATTACSPVIMLPSFCKVDGCNDKHSTFLHPPAVRATHGMQSDIGTQCVC